ncbi:hypothetical protein Nepgr_028458 [Nepenthes gracilis]|uniref:Uncharacterized protein n=1 Tax=Nepenthes gracilis TaxID=150966 RepID=A0AAD3TAE3_NEPGR|nr:hypothetical protein Nepgr_028458 [Nepenthes gracilis]
MTNSTGNEPGGRKITAEEVISLIKDDGDFDRLRLKIIRKLKDNEDLRNNIISVVKQSEALNRTGAENIKTGQLLDAIYEEVREKAMNQISDGLWEIIRSSDGMKTEITETVQSVYDKLMKPPGKEEDELASSSAQVQHRRITCNGSIEMSCETDGTISDRELKEPPGFPTCDQIQTNDGEISLQQPIGSERGPHEEGEPNQPNGPFEIEDGDPGVPPGFSLLGKRKHLSDASDEEPDVPPGFG